jgi:AcrR family transcriptional regulator
MAVVNQTEVVPLPRGKHAKDQRQRALVEAATAVFAEHGYDAATTREVAERAGCSEGLIHRYFGGKRGLLLAIVEGKVAEAVEAIMSGLPECDTVEEEINQIISLHLTAMWEHRDLMRVCVSRAIVDPELGRRINEGMNRQRLRFIKARLSRHQQVGHLRDDVDLDAVAEAVAGLGLLFGFVAQVAFAMDRAYVRRLAIRTGAMLSRGMVGPPARSSSNRGLRTKGDSA